MSDTDKQEKPLRVAFYIRVSTEEQAEKYGPEMQRRALDAIIASRGTFADGITHAMEFAGEQYVYEDSISGTTDLAERPGFSRLQEDILNATKETMPFDMVAVFKIDRFARRLKILLDTIDFFKKYDIQFISAHESIDTSTPFGRAILGIVGVLSELEMETINLRMQGGRKEAIIKGTFVGNTPPYGYEKDQNKILRVIEDEAKIVRIIYEKVLVEQLPINAICKYLEENQIESPGVSAITRKKRKGTIRKKSSIHFWSEPMIKKILTDEVYIGRYYYDKHVNRKLQPKSKWKLSPFIYDSIIDEGTFLRVEDILKKRKTTYTRTITEDDYVYPLGGLLKCTCCYSLPRDKTTGMMSLHGEPKEIGKGTGKYSHYYKCRRKNSSKSSIPCGSLPLPADQLEQYVVDRVKDLLAKPEIVFEYQRHLNSAKQERAQMERKKRDYTGLVNAIPFRIKSLQEQNEHGILDIETLITRTNDLQAKRADYVQKIDALKAKISTSKLDEGYIKSLEVFQAKYQDALVDITQDRAKIKQLLHMIIDRIEVHSRPITDKDVVAGRRSQNQMIPNKLVIFLRLPQEYLQMLREQIDKESEQFGVNLTNWSG